MKLLIETMAIRITMFHYYFLIHCSCLIRRVGKEVKSFQIILSFDFSYFKNLKVSSIRIPILLNPLMLFDHYNFGEIDSSQG